MRLIDADALKRNMFDYAPPEMVWDRDDINHKIDEMPTIDAVPVVRCKDCKHSYDSPGGWTCSHGVCVDSIVPETFYCKYGERKQEVRDGDA